MALGIGCKRNGPTQSVEAHHLNLTPVKTKKTQLIFLCNSFFWTSFTPFSSAYLFLDFEFSARLILAFNTHIRKDPRSSREKAWRFASGTEGLRRMLKYQSWLDTCLSI
jgi:hypothetical protein